MCKLPLSTDFLYVYYLSEVNPYKKNKVDAEESTKVKKRDKRNDQ